MKSINEKILEAVTTLISTHGNIGTVAYKLGVNKKTLTKLLNRENLSYPTYKHLRKSLKIGVDDSREQKAQSLIDLKRSCGEFLKENLPVQVFAKQFKTQESAIRKIAQGEIVNPNAMGKVAALIAEWKAGTLRIDYDIKHLRKLKKAYGIYQQQGTLQATGKILGVTRERIRQMLVKGTNLGLFCYRGYEYPYIEKEQILDSYEKSPNFQQVAKHLRISPSYLKKLLTAYEITPEELQQIRRGKSCAVCVDEYHAICKKLGRDATTTDLQSGKNSRPLYARIVRLWGGIDNFRDELKIVKPKKENFGERMRPWREKRQRLAWIIKMQHLDMIRETLMSRSPKPISAIAASCGLTVQKTYPLLRMLLSTGEVSKLGDTFDAKYTLA